MSLMHNALDNSSSLKLLAMAAAWVVGVAW